MSRHRNLPLYSIGAVCHLTGLSERRIRYYEQAGLLRPARTAGNQRRYSQADVDLLLEIKWLLQQGLHLEEIRRRLLERRGRDEVMGPPDVPAARAAAEPWPLAAATPAVHRPPGASSPRWPGSRWPDRPGASGAAAGVTEPPAGLGRIDRLFRGPAPAVPGMGTARSLYPALDPTVLYEVRRWQRRRNPPAPEEAGRDAPAAG
ncbi:MerR family transcriptional regulator [Thermaerobacter sp. PB12/4term]|uniref:MerR family transcriptional regulator n=1 Tax=Thermaerobacter sp. PB12/4term TaxID=2293838 RepID=UPI000E32B7E6|nr:MerR family transcriptional regulator [Thermaerobacter sp. PB12/4term]QIA26469.1 MerR family transcriptional regulator [Thermaerobacter sp. PB12/4term]